MQHNQSEKLRLLSYQQYREIMTVLNDEGQSVQLTTLANRLYDRDSGTFRKLETTPEQIRISLHHCDLPKLDDVGLVKYDVGQNVVIPTQFGVVDPDWLNLEFFGEFLSRFDPDRGRDTVGVVEGRDDILKTAQRLVAKADEELFLMIDDDSVFEECIHSVDAAIERGTHVTFGTRHAELRHTVRRQFSDITLWDPQLDWMNSPSRNPKIARLVISDRDQVLLAIRDESDADERPTELALIGEGEENPLVVLVRELMGPRLDHLDYQSDDFRSKLPF